MSLQSIGMFICFIICVCTQFTPGYLEGSSGNTEQKWRPNSYHERFDFIDDQVRQLLQVTATLLTSSRFFFSKLKCACGQKPLNPPLSANPTNPFKHKAGCLEYWYFSILTLSTAIDGPCSCRNNYL